MDSSLPPPSHQFPVSKSPIPELSIIIPARNEEAALSDCLNSLIAQTGVAYEIIVVDDNSTDRTGEITQSFARVQVISPEPLQPGWTGKNNALIAGVKVARAKWLLFTDADTVHLPGSLARALKEATNEQADLLSYSPEQIVGTFAERAVMPVIFAELAAQYPLRVVHEKARENVHKNVHENVREQNSEIVAANGQYILVCHEAYDAVGGHAAVATEILEDVALARLFRKAGHRVHFRYGGDAVRTRMYRNWSQLREGWTKNLALLFPQPRQLALWSLSRWILAWWSLGIAVSGVASRHFFWTLSAAFWLLAYRRIRIAHFTTMNNLIAMACGPPMFACLLMRSKRAHRNGQVSWKGRDYSTDRPTKGGQPRIQAEQAFPKIDHQGLRAKS
jgi:glycosyltransferase involved in cell wall biosynthesis